MKSSPEYNNLLYSSTFVNEKDIILTIWMQHKKRYYEGKKSMDRETKFKQTKSKEKKYFCGTGYFANICFQQTHDTFVYKLKTSYFIKLFFKCLL